MRLLLAIPLLVASPALADKPVTPTAARGSPEEIVCHRDVVTGTLARFTKTCMSRAGWQRQAENNQAATDELDRRGLINTCVAPGGCDIHVGPAFGGGGPGA